jgi:hypothetical protein
MIIHVEQEDIDAGIPRDCQECPVAIAIARQIPPPFKLISAGNPYIALLLASGVYHNIRTPLEVRRFMSDVDDDWGSNEPKPFSFDLPLPGERTELPQDASL